MISVPSTDAARQFLRHLQDLEEQHKTPEGWWTGFSDAPAPGYVDQIQQENGGRQIASWTMFVAVMAINEIPRRF
jgi:hypothetical protein